MNPYLESDEIFNKFNGQYDVDDAMSASLFWFHLKSTFTEMKEIYFRLFSTPVSSTTSEINFSLVNRVLTSDRSRMTHFKSLKYACGKVCNSSRSCFENYKENIYKYITDSKIDEVNYAVLSELK